MHDSSSKRKSNAKPKKKSKVKSQEKQKLNVKMLVIALFFIMLFVSYAVIFSGQQNSQSKNMVFEQDQDELRTYYGKVEDIEEDLSDIKITIRDASSKSENSTEFLEDGLILKTEGNFNCTFFDKNSNGKLDDNDEFIVYNVSSGDTIKLYLKSSDDKIAYYNF